MNYMLIIFALFLLLNLRTIYNLTLKIKHKNEMSNTSTTHFRCFVFQFLLDITKTL